MMAGKLRHPATAILRAVDDMLRIDTVNREKPILIVEDVRSVDWASVTFVGIRHEFDLRLHGKADQVEAAIARLGAIIGDADIAMAGYFVAQIGICDIGPVQPDGDGDEVGQALRIAALTIRD